MDNKGSLSLRSWFQLLGISTVATLLLWSALGCDQSNPGRQYWVEPVLKEQAASEFVRMFPNYQTETWAKEVGDGREVTYMHLIAGVDRRWLVQMEYQINRRRRERATGYVGPLHKIVVWRVMEDSSGRIVLKNRVELDEQMWRALVNANGDISAILGKHQQRVEGWNWPYTEN